MTALHDHLAMITSSEDQAIARLIGALRRRTAGSKRSGRAGQRPATRWIRSAGAVAEWRAMGRAF